MRTDIVGNGLSMPVELAVDLVVAGANAGFSFVSGVSTPKTAAIYIFASHLGGMFLRHGVHLGVEYLGSAVGLSEEGKLGSKILSELVVGHNIGQIVAKDLGGREITHLDALKLRAGTGIAAGAIAGLGLWLLQKSIQSYVSVEEPENLEEITAIFKKMESEIALLETNLQIEQGMFLGNATFIENPENLEEIIAMFKKIESEFAILKANVQPEQAMFLENSTQVI